MRIQKALVFATGTVLALALPVLGLATSSSASSGYPPNVIPPGNPAVITHTPETVSFPAGGSGLTITIKASINRTSALIRTHHIKLVYVVGYSSSTGTKKANLAESKLRADAVAKQLKIDLKAKGLGRVVIRTLARGSNNPYKSNSTAAGRAANQRAVIVFK